MGIFGNLFKSQNDKEIIALKKSLVLLIFQMALHLNIYKLFMMLKIQIF